MPRTTAKNKPGELRRDAARKDPKPKMNGQQWHEAKVKDFEAVSKAGAGAAPEVEGGGEEVGMGARRTRRKRMTPVGNAVGARRGAKGTNRAGNPG